MKIQFRKSLHLGNKNKKLLEKVNAIITDYAEQGYKLTLRQLYYQLVTKNVLPNLPAEYEKLGNLIVKGRMGGVVDWDAIEDRTRAPRIPYWVTGIQNAIDDTHNQYRLNRMEDQDCYIEMWDEKDALSSVLSRKTYHYHINLMVNRGYSSATAIFDSYNRIRTQLENDKKCYVLYLGDHDPSGLDMALRDIKERLVEMLLGHPGAQIELNASIADMSVEEYIEENFEVRHIGLTTTQVRQYNPPPNPAKMKDPRAGWYVEKFGNTSWEVDALNPEVLHQIIDDEIKSIYDANKFNEKVLTETEDKKSLVKLNDFYSKGSRDILLKIEHIIDVDDKEDISFEDYKEQVDNFLNNLKQQINF